MVEVRACAALALGHRLPDAGVTLDPLIGALKDYDGRVRFFATEAFVKLGHSKQYAH